MNNEFLFLWVSLIGVDKYTFIKLICNDFNLNKLYVLSLSPEKFSIYLNQNSIFISKKLFQSFINKENKIKASKIYHFCILNNIKMITFFSKEYNSIFSSNENSPLIILIYGNISILNKKKTFIYAENYESVNIKKILKKIEIVLNDKKYACLTDFRNSNMISWSKINILNIKEIFNISAFDKNKLYIFSNCENVNVISSLIENLIIINANYKKDIVFLVDLMLESGKDIFVFPNSILEKDAYFSNYLISEGANVVYNFKNMFK